MLFFENYQSVEVKPAKTPPEFGKLSPEGREFAKVGQNPCMEILLPTTIPRFRDEAHKRDYLRMRSNMLDTIKSVGGNFDGVDLTKVTVSELLLTLCSNNIAFVKTVLDNSY